jgi:hypothetical protein
VLGCPEGHYVFEVKFTLERAIKAQWKRKGIALLSL